MTRDGGKQHEASDSAAINQSPLLEVEGISKRFGPVVALDGVSVDVKPGEVHAVVGENGAGKSTLIKILAAVYRPDAGTMSYRSEPYTFNHPRQAQLAGISVVYQEFSLLPERTVAENIYLGREPRNRVGLVDRTRMNSDTGDLLAELHVADKIRPDTQVKRLPVALQQMVEIAKALSFDSQIVIMDEPTAALTPTESESLFERIGYLTERGVGILYVSHRMPEVFRLADRVTVLRDGQHVGTKAVSELSAGEVVSMMVGRELDELFPDVAIPEELGDLALEIRDAGSDALSDLNLSVRRGEIVGIGGLEGAGQQNLAEALFGLDPLSTGSVRVNGVQQRLDSPQAAIDAGIGYVPADRKQEGLILGMSVRQNLSVPWWALKTVRQRVTDKDERGRRTMQRLDLRASSMSQKVSELSGGNQQKVSIGKWVVSDAEVLVLHEPTRGIDIQAKALTHEALRQLARDGRAIVVISSDLPELIGLCDRIVVMRDGRFVGELPHGSTEDEVMRLAVEVDAEAVA